MTLLATAICFSLVWTLLHLWLVPSLEQRWLANSLGGKIAKTSMLVIAEKLREISAIGSIVLYSALIMVGLTNLGGIVPLSAPKAIIAAASGVYVVSKTISDALGGFIGFLLLVGAGLALWNAATHAKKRVVSAWYSAAQEEYDAIMENSSALDEARRDPELSSYIQSVDHAYERILEVNTQDPPDEAQQTKASDDFRSALAQLALEKARRRVDFPGAVETLEPDTTSEPAKAWLVPLRVMRSQNLSKDLGLVKTWVGRSVTALLFMSLLGWVSSPLADSSRLMMNNLNLNAAREQTNQQLNTLLSRKPAPVKVELSEEDLKQVQAASRLVARAVLSEVVKGHPLENLTHVTKSPGSEAEFVRSAISGQTFEDVDGTPASKIRQQVAGSIESGAQMADGSALKHLEREATPLLTQIKTRDPKGFDAFYAAMRNRYDVPLGALDAQGKLTERLLDEVFGAADLKPGDELGKQAQEVVKDLGKSPIKTFVDTSLNEFMLDNLTHSARPSVLEKVRMSASPRTVDLLQSLQMGEDRGWKMATKAAEEIDLGRKVAEAAANASNVGDAERALLQGRLSGYDDLFPVIGEAADVATTFRSPMPANSPHFERNRATSFRLASRSFRVRGVIIGQDISGPPLDIADVRWSVIPSKTRGPTMVRIELKVVSAFGLHVEWKDAGSYEAGVLNQALKYAADQRVVATTITPGDGKVISRATFLHPALIDTPLGCRIIESDRLVDTFSFTKPQSAGMSVVASDREAMGTWLSFANLTETASQIVAQGETCPSQKLQSVITMRGSKSLTFSPTVRQSIDTFVATEQIKSAPSVALIKGADRCARGAKKDAGACICIVAQSRPLGSGYWFPEDHTSQVREKPFTLTPDLAWLRPTPKNLGMVDFWVHSTFALRNGATGESDESTAVAIDFPASHLGAVRTDVSARLPGYLSSQLNAPSYGQFMAPVEDFIRAQRLVRAALEGKLGRRFPVTKLITLEKNTRKYVPRQVTLRWEAVEGGGANSIMTASHKASELYTTQRKEMMERRMTGKPLCDAASF